MSEYETRVKEKFPCPPGYRELTTRDKHTIVIDRYSLRKSILHTICPITRQARVLDTCTRLVIETPCVWYVINV